MSSDAYLLLDDEKNDSRFDFKQFLDANKISVILILIGLILAGFGAFLYKDGWMDGNDGIVVLEDTTGSLVNEKIIVEIVGAVEKPGVYDFDQGERIEDALIAAGGLSANASREWVEKNINRAAKLTDGQKILVYSKEEYTSVLGVKEGEKSGVSAGGTSSGVSSGGEPIEKVNINTAGSKELESLWGIGPVTAQNIIEHRPYSSVEELLEKKLIKSNVYERNKDLFTLY